MRTHLHFLRFVLGSAGLLLTLTACAGNGGGPPVSEMIGPAGGAVADPSGARVVIPPGALTQATAIAIEQTSAGAPALPGGLTAFGPMFAFTPHGTTFAVPVTLTLPSNSTSLPAGSTPELYKTNAGNQWERVAGAMFGANTVSASVTGFSFAQVVVPPLQRNDPLREWTFSDFRGRSMTKAQIFSGVKIGGLFEDIRDFGPVSNLTADLLDHEITSVGGNIIPQDRRANGQVFSTADGVTYGVFAEAPYATFVGEPAGSSVVLRQFQSFIKRAENASLTFTLTSAFIDLRDDGGGFDHLPTGVLECNYPPNQVSAQDACQDLVRGQVILAVQAYTNTSTNPGRTFFYTAGVAEMQGHTRDFRATVTHSMSSRTPLWSPDDFEADIFNDSRQALMSFKGPRTYTVDLSSIAVGEEFTLGSTALAEATNRQGNKRGNSRRELASAASAFLRDPLSIGGTTLTMTGLEPTNNPGPVPPVDVLVEPAPCTPGSDPGAGVLQFSAADYAIDEFGGATQPVRITRTGGSSGAVTATLTTGGGTAVAGTDYTPVNATVFFADGDTQARTAEIPILQNDADETSGRTVNLTLSQPGGCAALGPQNTAVLTLLDDDLPPPPPDPNGFLDPTFGTGGKVTTEGFGGDDSAMALQADGKVVMAGGSTDAFVLARYNADGNLDTSFGTGGKVTADLIPGGIVQEVANGVAVQPDGKIVVIGHTRSGPPFTFALARYNADGSPDTSFSAGGKVTTGVSGRAFAVALQPDGKLVVAGDDPVSEDFRLARYNPDGSLDARFGSGGVVTTTKAGGSEVARNVLVQPDGKIVVSGDPFGSGGSTGMARYTAGGSLDSSFGAGGTLTLTGARVGAGLALQPDGKFVLVGSVQPDPGINVTRFALRRLNADGSPDSGFGTAGSVTTAFTTQQDSASAVTLQRDGKILASGRSGQGNKFALARYNADGSLDASFLGGGTTEISFFGFAANAENVVLQADGKIVLGGFAQTLSNIGYALARINP
ncbi:hypothetical protein DAETH_37710 (plasmid) [Deinococcus aetherius]|uniref:Calx-beta domain-containing protein n=1 Tax=Deinococcus aetherius TaxID=200252 RepID=A0ABM8AJ19_9DEIO|nr:Calx-beta domain-containing protein [Deinococcus aetherius]BDP43802.1 hypothetical protein DAETH_37710 [Deinococcus aetherius]